MEEAVYGDCHYLITCFIQNENPSFESFCAQWKKIGFHHIFTPQTTYIELQQTVMAAFHFGKRLVCKRKATIESTDEFNEFNELDDSNGDLQTLLRIGGLYLLYSVYFKQPLERYTKIEVSLETFQAMKEFVRVTLPARVPHCDDARFVFWKLYQSEAFRFTALDFCVGLEKLVDYDNLDSTATVSSSRGFVGISRLIERLSSFVEIKQTAPALVDLENGYNEMKKSLTKKHKLDGQLLPPTNIFQNIQGTFKRIENMLNRTEKIEASSSTKQKSTKRSLKDKAFATKKKDSDKREIVESEKPKKQQKRMSSRTVFAEKLPEDIEEDLRTEEDDDNESDANPDSAHMETIQVNEGLDDRGIELNDNDETIEEDPLNTEHVNRVCNELLDGL